VSTADITAPGKQLSSPVGLRATVPTWWCAAGGSLGVGLVQFGTYLLGQAVIIARTTSEAGIPMAPGSFPPSDIWGMFGHQHRMGRTNLSLLCLTDSIFTYRPRGMLITSMFAAQKLADGVRMRRAGIARTILIALIVSVLVSGYLHMKITYWRGGLGHENAYDQLYNT
jgi:hypothetical protein